MTRDQLRKRAAERSRSYHYREQKPGIFAVGRNGCDHVLDADGACVKCDLQVVVVSRPVRLRG